MRAISTIAAALCICLGAAAEASAADWYANATPPGPGVACTQADPCATINAAVAKAGDGDTIHIAAGVYTESVSTPKRLTFAGNGTGGASFAGATLLNGTSSGPPLHLTGGGTVRDMVVIAAAGTGSLAPYKNAMTFDPPAAGGPLSYTVANVVAKHSSGGTEGGSAIEATSATRPLTLTVTGGQLLGDNELAQPLYLHGAGVSATLTGVTIDAGGDIGAAAVDGSTVSFDGGKITGASYGLFLTAATTTVRRATVEGSPAIDVQAGPASTTVRDSLLESKAPSGARALQVDWGGNTGARTVELTGSTLVARGPSPTAALSIATSSTNDDATVHAVDTVFRALPTDGSSPPDVAAASSGSAIAFDPRNSYFGSVNASGGATLPAPGSGSNVAGDPGFADPAGDNYALAPGSPLIDRGDPSVVVAGELDLVGAARSLDGNGDCTAAPDIGAYERPAAPATCTGPPDTTPPRITGVRFRPRRLHTGHRGRLRLKLSEQARLIVLVERRRAKRYRRVAKLAKVAGPGRVARTIGPKLRGHRLRTGRYRLRISAVDAAGNRSKVARVTFVVIR